MQPICMSIISQNYTLKDALAVILNTLETKRLSKEERGDLGELAVLYSLLALQKSYGDIFKVYHSVLLKKPNSDWTTEIDFVVVTPFAVFVIETKSFYGDTLVQKNHKLSVKNKYGTKEYDVVYQNQGHCRTLYELIYSSVSKAEVVRPVVTLFSVGTLTDSRNDSARRDYPVMNVTYLLNYIGSFVHNCITQKVKPTINLPKCIDIIDKHNIQSENEMLSHIKRIQTRYKTGGH